MDLLRLTLSELQSQVSCLQGIRDKWGGPEMFDIRVRAGGAAFSHTDVLAEAVVPLMSPPPTDLAGDCHI